MLRTQFRIALPAGDEHWLDPEDPECFAKYLTAVRECVKDVPRWEVVADAASETWTGMAVEHDELELVPHTPVDGHSPGTVDDADPAEPFGHS